MNLPLTSSTALEFHEHFLNIRWTQSGCLREWMGFDLRGLALRPLRTEFCLLSKPEQASRVANTKGREGLYCQGCERNAECLYGRVFEPDRKVIGRIENGMREGLRGIAIASSFPCQVQAVPGDLLPVRVLALGQHAKIVLPHVVAMLTRLGSTAGLGENRVQFDVDQEQFSQGWAIQPSELPTVVSGGSIPILRLQLITPYLVRRREDRPNFSTFVRESIRTVRRAVVELCGAAVVTPSKQANTSPEPPLRPLLTNRPYRDQIQDQRPRFVLATENSDASEIANWASFLADEFIQASECVECLFDQFELFQQERGSARQQKEFKMLGWTGSAVFRDVPVCLLPWLFWGGKIGVGESRNCGAGLWVLSFD